MHYAHIILSYFTTAALLTNPERGRRVGRQVRDGGDQGCRVHVIARLGQISAHILAVCKGLKKRLWLVNFTFVGNCAVS